MVAKPLNFTRTSIVLLLVTIFGMAFSGYLTYGVLSANTCPLNGGCTRVFGYPSCMYGFTMYTVMMIVVLLTLTGKVVFATGRRVVLLVSVIGMVELTWVTFDLNALTFRSFELFGAATIFYLILIFALINILASVEKRFAYKT